MCGSADIRLGIKAQQLPTAKPEDVGVSSERVGQLSTFMQSLVNDDKIAGGVTMMARNGKVIHLEAVGMADREAGTPMQTDTIFRIASMTKPITSVAVMMLWEEGKIGLDDPVSKYIPEFAKPEVMLSGDPLGTRPAKRRSQYVICLRTRPGSPTQPTSRPSTRKTRSLGDYRFQQ